MALNESQKKERSEYLEKNLVITECSQRKPYAFISYASDNWKTVFKNAVVPLQRQYGLCVYTDKAFDKVNDKWIVPMLRNIRGADVVVAFVSQNYIESYACFLELLTAVNNKKPIVFVSLEETLHLGDTTDLPEVERGVKTEIINQGSNIATNTNNTSNDLMRAMKSAYTSLATLLEQDALSKYDISDAFINFFRDAAINRKTINDLNAVKRTISSVSKEVFDKSLISMPEQNSRNMAYEKSSDEQTFSSSLPEPSTVRVDTVASVVPQEGEPNISDTAAGAAVHTDMPSHTKQIVGASHNAEQSTVPGNAISTFFSGSSKKQYTVAGICAAILLIVVISVAVRRSSTDDDSDAQAAAIVPNETTDTTDVTKDAEATDTDEAVETDESDAATSEDEDEEQTTESTRLEEAKPWVDNVLMKYTESSGDENDVVFGSDITRKEIISVTFLDSLDGMPDDTWDVSAEQDGRAMAWVVSTDGGYDLYIGAEGGVSANEYSRGIFANYCNVERIEINNNFHTDNVTNAYGMFYGCEKLTELDVSNFDTSKVTNMGFMFYKCDKLSELNVSAFDTSHVTEMQYMFYACENLAELDVSNFVTSKVTDMGGMFRGCSSLSTLDVARFDTSNVVDMKSMFYDCGNLTELDLSNFITSKVTDMGFMFANCSNLKSLDVSEFNTSNVTDMSSMFSTITYLTALDVSNFDTSKVTTMAGMFYKCVQLSELDVSGFDTSNVTDATNMFYNCKSLMNLDISNFDSSLVETMGL